MFFFISKVLSFLISPITWIIVLMIIAVFQKSKKRLKRLILISIIICYFFSNSFIATECIRLWEVPVSKEEQLDTHYEIGIVLGGGMITNDKDNNRLAFRINVDRMLQAVDLYYKGIVKKILISGGAGSLIYPEMIESNLLKQYFIRIGIPEHDIITEPGSDNTHENAVNTSIILNNQFPDGKYLLITSGYHMRRARACFKKEGIIADTYSTNMVAGKRRYQFDYLFLPNISSFKTWDKLIHEIVGYIVYRIMGYI
ncbi:YdcF family protein [candidate division KSB1 bacterium]